MRRILPPALLAILPPLFLLAGSCSEPGAGGGDAKRPSVDVRQGNGTAITDTATAKAPVSIGKPRFRDRRGLAYGLTKRPSLAGIKLPLDRGKPGAIQLTRVWPKLTFLSPTFITHAPDGTSRLFVLEQAGRILVLPQDASASSAKVFLDIRAKVKSGGERGLIGLAFDPGYKSNGYFYVFYSAPESPQHYNNIVARYKVSSTNPDLADAKSESIVMALQPPESNHLGGMLAFGKDKMLYISVGDGATPGDKANHGQNLNTLYGSILRVDVRTTKGYLIPKDNPYYGKANHKWEIWANGFRNPWRFSFDSLTGTLWEGDVGESSREEINIVRKGGNYAWRVFEGNINFNNPTNLKPSAFDMPIIDHKHDNSLLGARSIIGGYVYRGTKNQELRGAYIYGDYSMNQIWALFYDEKTKRIVSHTEIARSSYQSSYGEDKDGELYVLNHRAGTVWRLDRKGSGNPGGKIPTKLSLTGLFSDTAKLTPNPGLIEYSVNAPLWSDSAVKRRWIGVPDGQQITLDSKGTMVLPMGSILVKHFALDTGASSPTRVETRVLIHEKNGWAGYTYAWNSAQSDADLKYGGGTQTYKVRDSSAAGGYRTQVWSFPSAYTCMVCHAGAADYALGIKFSQLNRKHLYSTVEDNQLRAWNNIGLFQPKLDEKKIHEYPSLVDPYDIYQDLDRRSRSYLDVNCSMCHSPGSTAPGSMDMRFQTRTNQMNLVGIKPSYGGLGLSTPYRIATGKKESSVSWERMRRTDAKRMPAIGSGVVDKVGVKMLGSWIDSLK